MEDRQIVFNCQLSYEALQAYITSLSKFSNDYILMQISLREEKELDIEKYNKVLKILENINEIVLNDLSEARKYYNLLRTRKDIDLNKNSEKEIINVWGDVYED